MEPWETGSPAAQRQSSSPRSLPCSPPLVNSPLSRSPNSGVETVKVKGGGGDCRDAEHGVICLIQCVRPPSLPGPATCNLALDCSAQTMVVEYNLCGAVHEVRSTKKNQIAFTRISVQIVSFFTLFFRGICHLGS